MKEYRDNEHQKKHIAYNTAWNKTNGEKRRAIVKRWYWKHRDEILEKAKSWLSRTGKGREYNRINNSNRRAGDQAKDCRAKIKLLQTARFCHWCCTKLDRINLTIDHVIPLSRGGEHCPDNLVACCDTCNKSKGAKLVEDWLPQLRTKVG